MESGHSHGTPEYMIRIYKCEIVKRSGMRKKSPSGGGGGGSGRRRVVKLIKSNCIYCANYVNFQLL